eukprot:CAMPEP_0202964314 /NCGR_PEP_ID=MMETSP1396-20130829/8393_1 /ASSEMBLY_ACC=CAM_ASM_000872 /TAXON_ID= /ORGANISM="Pseudokeronopsis sp., Strain Brazil" /LENGTH=44 /DNA_ID= /DNA_START= /DNA_END= /DNA_ORIENTATION=
MTAYVAIGDQWFDQTDFNEPFKSDISEFSKGLFTDKSLLLKFRI